MLGEQNFAIRSPLSAKDLLSVTVVGQNISLFCGYEKAIMSTIWVVALPAAALVPSGELCFGGSTPPFSGLSRSGSGHPPQTHNSTPPTHSHAIGCHNH